MRLAGWLMRAVGTAIAHGGGHGGGLGSIAPEVGDIRIVDTSKRSLTMQAEVNFTNPTMYAVFIPFIDMHFLVNGTVLGHLVVKDMAVTPGRNERLIAQTIYDPESTSGDEGLRVGKEWLSQYVSGRFCNLFVGAPRRLT